MAILLRITVSDPQNVIDTYGAAPLYRIERATTSAMSGASEVTTGVVVAGTTEYEYPDPTGVAGTHWYRVRYSTATPSVAADYSGYGPVFQGGAPAGEVINLEMAKTWTKVDDTVDDGWLAMGVNAMNRAILRGVGVDLGPSPDTTRYYDGCRAVRNGTRLWIPGGIRSFATVAVTEDSGSSWTTITSDVRIGPNSHSRAPGEPGAFLEFVAYPTTRSRFPSGSDDVRVTCTEFAGFGWDAYPADLVQAGLSALQRMATDHDGRGTFPTETDAARYLNPATIGYYRGMYFPRVA